MAGGHVAGGVFGVAGLVVKKEIGREFAQKTAFGQAGGSRPPMQVFEAFMGRKPKIGRAHV